MYKINEKEAGTVIGYRDLCLEHDIAEVRIGHTSVDIVFTEPNIRWFIACHAVPDACHVDTKLTDEGLGYLNHFCTDNIHRFAPFPHRDACISVNRCGDDGTGFDITLTLPMELAGRLTLDQFATDYVREFVTACLHMTEEENMFATACV